MVKRQSIIKIKITNNSYILFILHLFSFKPPTSWAEMSEGNCCHCAFSMRNGVINYIYNTKFIHTFYRFVGLNIFLNTMDAWVYLFLRFQYNMEFLLFFSASPALSVHFPKHK